MKETINLNQPLLKSESGLLVDPSVITDKQNQLKQFTADKAVEKYNERYQKNSNAPIPNIRVPYSYILTRAVPPEMKGYTESGLVISEIQVDVRMAKKLDIMSENVSDLQEVLLVGHIVDPTLVQAGDVVRINYDKYLRLNDDHTAGVIQKSYEIPLYEIDGNEYLLIDSRDIIYSIPKLK